MTMHFVADWQAQARRAAQHEGIDPDLYVALVRQESGGQMLTSKAGAIGPSQLMPATARSLGVDPSDYGQNLAGGAKYLRQQLDRFGGDVRKALAAYNAGPGAVQKYGGVPPYAETQAYVKSILGGLGGSTGRTDQGTTPAAREVSPTASVSAAPAVDSSALLDLLQPRQRQAPAGTGNLPTPQAITGPALPDAYRALASGQAPRRDGRDLGALVAQIRSSEQETSPEPVAADLLASDASTKAEGKGDGFHGSGVKELIFNDGGNGYGIKNGQEVTGSQVFGAVWAGHANHVHVAAGPKTVVKLGKLAQKMGLHVGENPAFGGVDVGAHVPNSYHARNMAIDVSGDPKLMSAFAKRVDEYNRTRRL